MEELDLVGGRYRLVKVIGAGGMGRVWLADDELLGRSVAIKEINTPAEATASLGMQLATMREARATARLDHPGVMHVYDVIWRPGTSWIVMEYVPSRSLHEVGAAEPSRGGPDRTRRAGGAPRGARGRRAASRRQAAQRAAGR